MAGLQRSGETFRRSGSSGLVWEDRFLPEEMKEPKKTGEGGELRQSRSVGSAGMLDRNRSNGGGGGGGGQGYRTGRVSPALDPPSPKLSVCGFCGIFGKQKAPAKKAKHGRR